MANISILWLYLLFLVTVIQSRPVKTQNTRLFVTLIVREGKWSRKLKKKKQNGRRRRRRFKDPGTQFVRLRKFSRQLSLSVHTHYTSYHIIYVPICLCFLYDSLVISQGDIFVNSSHKLLKI